MVNYSIVKHVKLEIDGKDFETLANACEAGRLFLLNIPPQFALLFTPTQVQEMLGLISKVLEVKDELDDD